MTLHNIRPARLSRVVCVLTIAACAAAQGGEPAIPTLRTHAVGPSAPALSCDGGDRNGLVCSRCSLGARDGEPCLQNADCPSGQCVATDEACPGMKPDGSDATCTLSSSWIVPRFLPFRAEGVAVETAIRVTVISDPWDFSLDGQVRWLDAPVEYFEGDSLTPEFGTYWASLLVCEPALFDWTSVEAPWIAAEEIRPLSLYALQQGDASCIDAIESGGSDDCLSPPFYVRTGKIGDAGLPFHGFTGVSQPTVVDILAHIDKFIQLPSALTKPRLALVPSLPKLNTKVDKSDILASIDSFLGMSNSLWGWQICP